MSYFLVMREEDNRNRWRDGQVCPDVGQGIMAPWARRPEGVLIVRVQYFVRGGFVGHRSRVSSKHLSSHLPVDGVRFLEGQKGVALQLQDARVGVGSNKDADHSRCSEK
ncbi:uncharacterized protein TNCV_734451 [Trichonephila clavipes]|nr:uncharacterized protein TNCV_734451 [Trichonephila clavipes]